MLHFLDRVIRALCRRETEFRHLPPDLASTASGLTRIDHVAQAMSQEELRTWTLFYTIFDTVRRWKWMSPILAASQSALAKSDDGALPLR